MQSAMYTDIRETNGEWYCLSRNIILTQKLFKTEKTARSYS